MIFRINVSANQSVPMGRRGENEVRTIEFDCSPFSREFPGGVPVVLLKRPGDTDPYPVPVDVDGAIAKWTVRAVDVEKAGIALLEVNWIDGGKIAKSATMKGIILNAIGTPSAPPDPPIKGWVEKVLDAASVIISNIGDAMDAAASALASAASATASARVSADSASEAAYSSAESERFALESKKWFEHMPDLELRVEKLEAAAEGNLYMFREDSTESYSKAVPADAMKWATLDRLGGKTVVRNQKAGSSPDWATSNNNYVNVQYRITPVLRHKYLICAQAHETDGTNFSFSSIGFWNDTLTDYTRVFANYVNGAISTIYNFTSTKTGLTKFVFQYIGENSDPTSKIEYRGQMVVDLTQWFGSAIADTITTPEQAYALGVPRDYIPYDEGTLVSADVERVNTGVEIKEIPSANLPGYGWSAGDVYNYVDFEKKQYVQRVGSVDLGTVNTWSYDTDSSSGKKYFNFKKPIKEPITSAMLTPKFGYADLATQYLSEGQCNSRGFYFRFIAPDSIDSIEKFRDYIGNDTLLYELENPIITDISDLITNDFEDIEVEAGGTITFQQSELALPVPNQETWMIKLGGATT